MNTSSQPLAPERHTTVCSRPTSSIPHIRMSFPRRNRMSGINRRNMLLVWTMVTG